ncbi:hypothetical protein [Streptomyces sp. PvR034]
MDDHGYPCAVRQLLHGRPTPAGSTSAEYVEEGATTAPYGLLA